MPWRTYRGFIYFWHVVTVTGLSLALYVTIYNAGANDQWTWQIFTVIAALILQLALYLGLLVFNPVTPWKRWVVPTYFSLGIALWFIETLLYPEIFWVGFMYIGQLFGMISLLPAAIGAGFILLVIFTGIGVNLRSLSPGELFGWIAGWTSILVLLVYMNRLGHTSSERARLIEELKRTQEELEAAREKEAELAVLRERERLARDMHDSLGHNLVALSVQLEAVQRLYAIDPEAAIQTLDDLKTLTRTSMEELRRTLAGLRSPALGSQALGEALQKLCGEFSQRTRSEVTCRIEAEIDALPPMAAEALWRSAQEALTNIEKHAGASRVTLQLGKRGGDVFLLVQDNGRGFDPGHPAGAGHFGLIGMRERVEGIGGQLQIRSQPTEGGTTVEIHIPTMEKFA
jgi:signal transduction histidine kinase